MLVYVTNIYNEAWTMFNYVLCDVNWIIKIFFINEHYLISNLFTDIEHLYLQSLHSTIDNYNFLRSFKIFSLSYF